MYKIMPKTNLDNLMCIVLVEQHTYNTFQILAYDSVRVFYRGIYYFVTFTGEVLYQSMTNQSVAQPVTWRDRPITAVI